MLSVRPVPFPSVPKRITSPPHLLPKPLCTLALVTFSLNLALPFSLPPLPGSESNWLERYKLEQVDGVGDYILRKSLPVGTYQYKFIVDGRWRVSPEETAVRDSKGEVNNQVTVAADATVTIFYKTGWTNPRMLVVDTTQPNALPLTLPKPKAPAPGAKPGAEVAMEPSPYPEVRHGPPASRCKAPRRLALSLYCAPPLRRHLFRPQSSPFRGSHPSNTSSLFHTGALLGPPPRPLEDGVPPRVCGVARQRGLHRRQRGGGGGGGIPGAPRSHRPPILWLDWMNDHPE